MYRLLEYDSARQLPPICDLYEKGISLSGLSKSFALPGLRLGWLAMQGRALVSQWLTYKDYTTICNSAPSEVLGIMALRAKEAIIARNLNIIRQNLIIAEQFFAEQQNRFSLDQAAGRFDRVSALGGRHSSRTVLSGCPGSTERHDRPRKHLRFSGRPLPSGPGSAEFRRSVAAGA